MTTNTLRLIAELNISPLVRISRWSIAATICAVLGYATMLTDWCYPFFFAAVLLADQHIRWDSSRHNRNAR